jgi:SSS family solute:Na+ symporter
VTAWGAVAAIGSGTAVTLLWNETAVKGLFPALLSQRDAIFPALLVAVAAMILVSLVTKKPTAAQLAKFQ